MESPSYKEALDFLKGEEKPFELWRFELWRDDCTRDKTQFNIESCV